MGQIIKYNIAKGDDGKRVKSVTYNVSSAGYPTNTGNSSSTSGSGSSSINCVLWGNSFTGGNLSNSMTVNGDIYLYFDEDDFDVEYDEEDGDEIPEMPTGSIYISGKAEASSVYGKKVAFDFNSTKTDLETDQKRQDTNITNNANNIANLTTRVTNVETHQANQDVMINANVSEILGLKQHQGEQDEEISDIKDKIAGLEAEGGLTESSVIEIVNNMFLSTRYGSVTQPVCLFAGYVTRNEYTNAFSFVGSKLDCINTITCSVDGGLMTLDVSLTSGFAGIFMHSAHATQQSTTKTANINTASFGNMRDEGAHWFECRLVNGSSFDNKRLYIREFHSYDSNNDSWTSQNWKTINSVFVTVMGYALKS